jgi:hypothetical protein
VDLVEDVEGAGEQLAARPRRHLGAAAVDALGMKACERRLGLGPWAASVSTERTAAEPCLVMWPWRALRSELRTGAQHVVVGAERSTVEDRLVQVEHPAALALTANAGREGRSRHDGARD